jgi:DNA-binding transcriptional LysR family regulator
MDATSDLRVFVRVMDRGSFSSAANDLGLTPSAVSKLISRLEDRLGARLLARSTRRLALTPEGEGFLARARRIVADIEEAEAEVARARGAPRGKLRINSGTAFGLHQLAPTLADFLGRYPEIDVDLSITDVLSISSRSRPTSRCARGRSRRARSSSARSLICNA